MKICNGKYNKLSYLAENELAVMCPLLSVDSFISFCKERGIFTYREQLEQFEKLGLFYPFARVRRQKLTIKIEYTEDRRRYRDLGVLANGEQWTGDTKKEYAGFSFEKDWAEEYLKENRLWEPHTKPFQPWTTFIDEDGDRHTESFYSRFQIYILYQLLKLATLQVNLEWLEYPAYKESILKKANSKLASLPKLIDKNDDLVFVSQVISNRYFPHSQSDHRTITITSPLRRTGQWDWYEYCRNWDSNAVAADLGIETEALKTMHGHLQRKVNSIDPLASWYELISFISVERRQRLKGEAALAQELYVQEIMLRQFYKDITGEKLPAPDESWDRGREAYYGKNAIDDPLIYLEFLTNKYHLNPKPRLILIVEGEGEFQQFPRLARELFGYDFSTAGVRIMNLGGVNGINGLKRFIDYHHNRQTLVFIILDDEGPALKTKQELVAAQSMLYQKRHIIKEEHIHLWKKNVEFDNFSDKEIAQAMTKLAEQLGKPGRFEPDEMAECRLKNGDQLSALFKQKCLRHKLPKPELLRTLFDEIITNRAKEVNEKDEMTRPIVQLMKTIITLAGRNHQPSRFDTWKENQESGYFGDVIE